MAQNLGTKNRAAAYASPATKTRPLSTCETHGPKCTCCTGLECLERPRYFAGMLLTDTELQNEQDYVRAKNRLHNRYLHGWGVVCGLQVVCNDCEGFVTVKSGYAIDPCGNDIIVCKDQDVNFAQLIRACRDREERECDPMQMLADKGCEDAEENWCLTLCYDEQEARPVTTLRREKAQCGCGCNGNGKRSGCGCGCHDEPKKMSAPMKAQSGVGVLTAPCEPTRIFEGYVFGATPHPPDDCDPRNDRSRDPMGTHTHWTSSSHPYEPANGKTAIKSNTLRYQLACCRDSVRKLMQAPKDVDKMTPQQAYNACCQYRKSIQKFFADASLTRCDLYDELAALQCPPPPEKDGNNAYSKQAQETVNQLRGLLSKYILDCLCLALLPPCAPDPVEDRIILACITVKGDKIVRICNFEGRRQVITLPALEYWLSELPLWQRLVCKLKECCCGDGDLFSCFFDRRAFAQGATFEKERGANFAFGNAGMVEDLMVALLGQMLGADFLNAAAGKSMNLYDATPYIGMPLENVKQRFDAASIKYAVSSADTWSDQAIATSAAYAPTAVSLDEPLTLYTKGDVVIGIEPTTAAEMLRSEVVALRREVDALKGKREPPSQKPGGKAKPFK